MSDKKIDDTQENKIIISEPIQEIQITSGDSETTKEVPISKNKSSIKPTKRRWKWILGLLLGLFLFIALGALGGLQSGISARQGQERLDRAVEAVAQYQLGQIDIDSGSCDIARQRFEYVIQLNPSYPGVAEKLAEAMLCTGIQEAPAAIATIEPSPIPEGQSVSELFNQASAFFAANNWNEVLPLLDTLRSIDDDYEAIRIDGMYYTALRNRGVERILGEGDLEGGIFDLNQAEQVGPLDIEAANYREWAILYIVGQSFWEVDWGQAVQFFGQIAAVAPNLYDASFYTSTDRYADASSEYAKDLISSALFIAGAKGWCEADQIMRSANDYNPHSPEIQVTAAWVTEKCLLNPNEEADLN